MPCRNILVLVEDNDFFSLAGVPIQSTTDRFDYFAGKDCRHAATRFGTTAVERQQWRCRQLLACNLWHQGVWRVQTCYPSADILSRQWAMLALQRARRRKAVQVQAVFSGQPSSNEQVMFSGSIAGLSRFLLDFIASPTVLIGQLMGGVKPTRETCTVAFWHQLSSQQGILHVHVFRGDLASDMIIQVTAFIFQRMRVLAHLFINENTIVCIQHTPMYLFPFVLFLRKLTWRIGRVDTEQNTRSVTCTVIGNASIHSHTSSGESVMPFRAPLPILSALQIGRQRRRSSIPQ